MVCIHVVNNVFMEFGNYMIHTDCHFFQGSLYLLSHIPNGKRNFCDWFLNVFICKFVLYTITVTVLDNSSAANTNTGNSVKLPKGVLYPCRHEIQSHVQMYSKLR